MDARLRVHRFPTRHGFIHAVESSQSVNLAGCQIDVQTIEVRCEPPFLIEQLGPRPFEIGQRPGRLTGFNGLALPVEARDDRGFVGI